VAVNEETPSREVEKFFGNLRADPLDGMKRTGTQAARA